MKTRTIQIWVAVGVTEIILSLFLLAFAPIFLNSHQPLIGFLMWASVLLMLGGSGLYVMARLNDASRGRRLFITRFPEYHHLTVKDFLEIPAAHVMHSLEMLDAARADPAFQALHISLFDLLRSSKKR